MWVQKTGGKAGFGAGYVESHLLRKLQKGEKNLRALIRKKVRRKKIAASIRQPQYLHKDSLKAEVITKK